MADRFELYSESDLEEDVARIMKIHEIWIDNITDVLDDIDKEIVELSSDDETNNGMRISKLKKVREFMILYRRDLSQPPQEIEEPIASIDDQLRYWKFIEDLLLKYCRYLRGIFKKDADPSDFLSFWITTHEETRDKLNLIDDEEYKEVMDFLTLLRELSEEKRVESSEETHEEEEMSQEDKEKLADVGLKVIFDMILLLEYCVITSRIMGFVSYEMKGLNLNQIKQKFKENLPLFKWISDIVFKIVSMSHYA